MLALEARNITTIAKGLKAYYQDADQAHKIILKCAVTAAAAEGIGGLIPGLSLVTTVVSCVGAVWTMYGLLCKTLGISIKSNVLKLLGKAALTNISCNLGAALLGMLAAQLIPGASVMASAIIAFVSVYLAGLLFLQMILSMAQKSKDPTSFSDISEKEMKETISKIKLSRDDLTSAKDAFIRHQDEMNPDGKSA